MSISLKRPVLQTCIREKESRNAKTANIPCKDIENLGTEILDATCYRRVARKEYLALVKSKKRTEKKIRATIRKQLECVRRDLGYLERYMGEGYALPGKYTDCYLTIRKLYKQQKYMYDSKTHSVQDRIVSISQPYLRPIVQGKSKTPVEFGAKYDVSIDEKGHARLEKLSFDAYNESTVLIDAMGAL